jgi:hypothetical protein
MKPTQISRSRADRLSSLRRLAVALLAVAGAAMGQTAAPVGVATSAEYDCSGLEGVALTSCRQLNAAAIQGAMVRSDGSPNFTHDCADMSGAALARCRELNGQPAIPVTTSGPGPTATTGVSNPIAPSGAAGPAAASTTQVDETTSGTEIDNGNQPKE